MIPILSVISNREATYKEPKTDYERVNREWKERNNFWWIDEKVLEERVRWWCKYTKVLATRGTYSRKIISDALGEEYIEGYTKFKGRSDEWMDTSEEESSEEEEEDEDEDEEDDETKETKSHLGPIHDMDEEKDEDEDLSESTESSGIEDLAPDLHADIETIYGQSRKRKRDPSKTFIDHSDRTDFEQLSDTLSLIG